jgi:hypothetical protein
VAKPSGKRENATSGLVPDDPEQLQRFIEAARELGADTPEAVETTGRASRRMPPSREPGKPVERQAAEPRPKRTCRRKESTP